MPTPIVLDDAIRDVLTATGPSLKDIQNMPSRDVVESASGDAETLDELIAELEEMRQAFGGDAAVEDFECGGRLHIHALEYDDGEVVVRL